MTVTLLANNEPVDKYTGIELPYEETDDENVEFTRSEDDNTWTLTVKNLPVHGEDGNLLTYSWIEEIGEGSEYTMTGYEIDGGTTTITNTLETDRFCLAVLKVWDDEEAGNKTHPELTVNLMKEGKDGEPEAFEDGELLGADGKAIKTEYELNEGNHWTAMATGLPKNEFTYVWVEDETTIPEGYVLSNSETTGTITYLTNSYNVPELEKKTKDTNDTTGETSGLQDSADYDIGDAVPFTLSAKLPASITAYSTYKLTFTDEMSEGLTFDEDSVVVKLKGEELAASQYEVTKTDDQHFSVAITLGDGETKFAESMKGAEVTVEYEATLNESAKLGSAGNTNTVGLSYSNNPDKADEMEEAPEGDTVIIFTYGVTFNKVDEDGEALEGAEFELYKIVNGEEEKVDLTGTPDEEGKATTFSAEGLDDGDYVLKETKTPEGYEAIADIEFTVTAEHEVVWNGTGNALTSLNGDAATGIIALTADKEEGTVSGDVKNEPLTEATVIKVWNDNSDAAGKRGDAAVTVTLLANNEPVEDYKDIPLPYTGEDENVTFKKSEDENTWTLTVKNLSNYDEDGNLLTYSWVEKIGTGSEYVMTGYEIDGDTTTITNTLETDRFCLAVLKVWNDDNNSAGFRPDELKVTLMKVVDGEPVAFEDGELLNADGEAIETEYKLNEGNHWTAMVKGLPRDDFEYVWVEDESGLKITDANGEVIAAYTPSSKTEDTITYLTNTYEPEKVWIDITKQWDDGDDQDGIRPDHVDVKLMADEEFLQTVRLDEEGNFTAKVENLPKYVKDEGDEEPHEIEYTWEEYKIDGYELVKEESTGEQDEDGNWTVVLVNKHVPTTEIVIDGTKIMPGATNLAGFEFVLLDSTGETVSTAISGKDGTFKFDPITYKISDLDEGATEKEFTYTVKEVAGDDESIQYDDTEYPVKVTLTYDPETGKLEAVTEGADDIEFTNIETTEISVEKIWDDDGDRDGIRKDVKAKVSLLAQVEGETEKTVKETVEVPVTDGLIKTWDNLPVYTEDGKRLTYSVIEILSEGSEYTASPTANVASEVNNGDTLTITNTYKPETTEVKVTKAWEDNENQDGKRPNAVFVNLLADDEPIDSAVLVGDKWTHTWKNLPKNKNVEGDVSKIEYSVKEVGATENKITFNGAEYEVEISGDAENGYTITNSRMPELTKAVVIKSWDDGNDAAGFRPTTVTMKLLANNEETGFEIVLPSGTNKKPTDDIYKDVTITKDEDPENPKATLDKLPQYVDGVYQTYSWIEDTTAEEYAASGYSMSDIATEKAEDGSITTTITNSYTPDRFCLAVLKVWDDADNQDGLRPDSLEVTLYANGEIAQQDGKDVVVTLDDSNNWTALVTGLPMDADGKPIEYKWSESDLPEGYTLEGADEDGFVTADLDSRITTLTNTHEPEFTNIPITKVWDDADDQDGIRPKQIEVLLLADGEPVQKAVIKATSQDDDGNWIYTFENLPKYNHSTTEIEYTVEEINVPEGYIDTVEGDAETGYTITNEHTPNTVEIEITKVWEDADDQDGLRPTAEEFKESVHLKANGVITTDYDATKTVTDNGDNTYTVKWTDLPEKLNKVTINYSVIEDAIKDYETDEKEAADGGVIINRHTPEETEVTIEKVWEDNENQAGIRPDHIDLKLLADGEEIKTIRVETQGDGSWTYTETGLPKNKNVDGEVSEIEYTFEEYDLPEGLYNSETVVNEDGSTTITNTLKTGSLTISKTVDSPAGSDSEKKFEFTVILNMDVNGEFDAVDQDGGATKVKFVNGSTEEPIELADGETLTIEGLPAGITYTVVEKAEDYFIISSEGNTGIITEASDETSGDEGEPTRDGNTAEAEGSSAEAAFTNTRETGDLVVSKTVDSTNEGDKNKEFHFTITLGDDTVSGTFGDITFTDGVAEFTLKDGDSKTATGLPAGITYEVAEEEDGQDGFVTVKTGETGTIVKENVAEAAFTNVKSEGGLVVSKRVISALEADHDTEFTFQIKLTGEGAEDVSGTFGGITFTEGESDEFTLKDGEYQIITGLPDGMAYTVTETSAEGFTTTVDGETTSEIEGSISKDETQKADFVNTRDTGKLTLTKEVDSESVDDYQTLFGFIVTLEYEGETLNGTYGGYTFEDGEIRVWLKAGETVTIDQIPVGTEYTVTEEADDRFEAVITVDGDEVEEASGTIEASESEDGPIVEVIVTNTRKTGDIVISKEVKTPVEAEGKAEFTFTIQLNEAVNGTFTAVRVTNSEEEPEPVLTAADDEDKGDGEESGEPVDFTDGKATVTVAGGETLTIKGLPAGVTYTIIEAIDNRFNTTADGEKGNVAEGEVAEGDVAEVPFVNERKTGGLEVKKQVVSSNTADNDKEFTFKVTLSDPSEEIDVTKINGTFGEMEFDEGVATFTLTHGATKTADGLPTGITYTVEEATEGQDGYQPGFVTTKTGETGVICLETAHAGFTNIKDEGGLIVSKSVISSIATDHTTKEFEFTVELTGDGASDITGIYGEMEFSEGVAKFTLKDGEIKYATGLPIGMEYTVTETADNLFTTTVNGETNNEVTGTIEKKQAGKAQFVNTAKTGELTVTKTVNSDVEGDDKEAFLFTITLTYKGDPLNGVYGGYSFTEGTARFWLRDGEKVTFTNLPIGTEYKVTEVEDPRFDTESSGDSGMIDVDDSGEVVAVDDAAFTNTRETTEWEAEKIWDDDDDRDGVRPGFITMRLLADGEVVSDRIVTADSDPAWTVKWEDLPKYRKSADGKKIEIEYTVDELPIENYTPFIELGDGKTTITNKYTPEETFVVVKKAWDDANDQDGVRPDDVKVTLFADGEVYQQASETSSDDSPKSAPDLRAADDDSQADTEFENPATLNADNGWTYTWYHLPKYKDHGTEIKYEVKEDEVPEGYELVSIVGEAGCCSGIVVTNKHVPEVTEHEVEKTWKDADDHDKIRPKTLTFKLLADGKEVEGQTVIVPVEEDGTCTYKWENLPKYKKGIVDGKEQGGIEIKYSAFEVVPEGYNASADTAEGTTTITNTHAIATTAVWVLKTWDDANDQDGKRKEAKFTLTAFAGGKEITPQMYDAENDEIKDVEEVTWSTLKNEYHIWSKLLKTLDGEEISYQVDEEEIEDYTTTMESSSPTGFRYKNTHIPETVEISVTKVWEDGDNCCKKRPYTVSAQLYADGETVGIPLVLSQINNWTRTWKNLPKYKIVEETTTDDEGNEVTTKTGGHEIVYTVEEVDKPDGYLEPEISGSVEEGFVITNTIDTVEISGKKTWDDGYNVDKLRPEKITIRLFADGKVVKGSDKVVTADTYWMYKWTDLPKYNIKADGTKTEIVYTVVEDPVQGYVAKYKKGSYDITNKHTPKKPCTPTTPGTPGGGYKSPVKTGDDTPIAPYMLLFFAAAAIILEEAIRRRRKASQSKD